MSDKKQYANHVIPNSFQTPNVYIDLLLELLTDSELRILLFATRHILGWREKIKTRKGIISLEMFVNGYGPYPGCGLNKQTVIKTCKSLVTYKILEKDGITRDGTRWHLVEDFDDIEIEQLETRHANKKSKDKKRTENMLEKLKAKRLKLLCDNTPPVLCDNTPPVLCDNTESNLPSNLPSNTKALSEASSDDETFILFCHDCGGYKQHTGDNKFCDDCMEDVKVPVDASKYGQTLWNAKCMVCCKVKPVLPALVVEGMPICDDCGKWIDSGCGEPPPDTRTPYERLQAIHNSAVADVPGLGTRHCNGDDCDCSEPERCASQQLTEEQVEFLIEVEDDIIWASTDNEITRILFDAGHIQGGYHAMKPCWQPTDTGRAALEAYQTDVRLHEKLSAIGNCGCGFENGDDDTRCEDCQAIADTLDISDSGVITEKPNMADDDILFDEIIPTKPLAKFKVKARIGKVTDKTGKPPAKAKAKKPKRTPEQKQAEDNMFEAVKFVWRIDDNAVYKIIKMKQWFLGSIKKTSKKYGEQFRLTQLEQSATAQEVVAFGHWYRTEYDDIPLPENGDKLRSHFDTFRGSGERWQTFMRKAEKTIRDNLPTIVIDSISVAPQTEAETQTEDQEVMVMTQEQKDEIAALMAKAGKGGE